MFKSILFIVQCVLVSCSHQRHAAAEVQVYDSALLDDLRLIQNHRIYFGHQAVGANVVDGLRDLTGASSGAPLTLVSFAGAALPAGGVFAESAIGENGRPETKFDAFSRNIKQLMSSGLNVAL